MSESVTVHPRRDLVRPGWAHNYSHANEEPPTYSDSLRWLLYNSLRPAFIIAHGLATFVSIVLAAVHWRSLSLEDGKVKTLSVVSALLFTLVFLIELVGFLMGLAAHVGMVKLFSRTCIVALIMALIAQVVSLANVYANRHPMISQCIAYESRYTGDVEQSGDDATVGLSASEICSDMWHSSAIWNIVWLVLITLVGTLIYVLTLRYLSKIQDPGAGTRLTRPYTADDNHDPEMSNAYPMSTMPYSMFGRDELDTRDDAFDDPKIDFDTDTWEYPHIDHDAEEDEFLNSIPLSTKEPTIIMKPTRAARSESMYHT